MNGFAGIDTVFAWLWSIPSVSRAARQCAVLEMVVARIALHLGRRARAVPGAVPATALRVVELVIHAV